jgi:hypothetical protein
MPAPSFFNPRAGEADPQSKAGQSSTRAALHFGAVYYGIVTEVDAVGLTYTVALENQGIEIPGCRWGGLPMMALFGFQMNLVIPVGTPVAVVYGTKPTMFGGFSPEGFDTLNNANKRTAGFPEVNRMKSKTAGAAAKKDSNDGAPMPSDLLEGEFEIANALGVALQMLTTMTKLKAGDKAKIECLLLNDMVRVFSENFRQFSAFGDFQIYNDGRLNMRWDGTSYAHEAEGRVNPKEPVQPTKNFGAEFSDDPMLATGRWRLSQLVGWLGDFVHLWITDPADTIGKIGELALRSGKASAWVGNDGSVVVQSVADIVLERVVRIPVPVEMKRWDDPAGVTTEDFFKDAGLPTEFLQTWNYRSKPELMFEALFQIRQYSRYLSRFHAMARLRQMEKLKGEWKIPLETEVPVPDYTNKEKDVKEANPNIRYVDAYACIRIMRDGSVLVMATGGEAISMYAGNVTVSSARHLRLEAAGDISLIAGQNIYVKARRSLELTAVVGSLTCKARTALMALCEWGPVWLKSDKQDPKAPGYSPKTKADQPFPDQDPDPQEIKTDNSVIIETPVGRTYLGADRGILLDATGKAAGGDTPDVCGVAIQTQSGGLVVRLGGDLGVTAKKIVGLATKIRAAATSVFLDTTEFQVGAVFAVFKGAIHATLARVRVLYGTSSIFGPPVGAQPEVPDKAMMIPLKPHYNHILPLKDSKKEAPELSSKPEGRADLQKTRKDMSKGIKKNPSGGNPMWTYPEAGKRDWPGDNGNRVYWSVTQAQIQLVEQDAQNKAYEEFPAAKEYLQSGIGTTPELPGPWDKQTLVWYPLTMGDRLDKPSAADQTKAPQTGMGGRQGYVFRFLKK